MYIKKENKNNTKKIFVILTLLFFMVNAKAIEKEGTNESNTTIEQMQKLYESTVIESSHQEKRVVVKKGLNFMQHKSNFILDKADRLKTINILIKINESKSKNTTNEIKLKEGIEK